MQFPIIVGLRRSRFIDGILLALFVLGGLTISVYPVEAYWRLLLFVVLCALGAHAWRGLSSGILKLRLERDGSVQALCCVSGDWLRVSPLPENLVHPWLTVLRLRTEGGRRFTLPLTVDSMNPQDFRRLRVFLRWQVGARHLDDAA